MTIRCGSCGQEIKFLNRPKPKAPDRRSWAAVIAMTAAGSVALVALIVWAFA